jgi:methyl-accepting chemotaxis protein
MKLKDKLLSMIMIPMLGLVYFSVSSTLDKARQAREMTALTALAGISTKIGALAHELQKERGMSAGYLGSKGANFADQLPKQRQESDRRLEDFRQRRADFDAAGYGAELAAALASAEKNLGELPAKRREVDALSIAASDEIAYYSRTIAALLAVTGRTASLADDSGVARRASAYNALLQGKERAGIERALLSNVFGVGQFSPDMLVRFLSNAAAQDTWLAMFHGLADPGQAGFFQTTVVGPAVEQVAAIKREAIEKMSAPALGFDAKLWFAKATERIDLLKQVEDRLADDLVAEAERLRTSANQYLGFYLALEIAILAATLWIAFAQIRGILGQIGGEPEDAVAVAQAIAGGKLDNPIALKAGDRASLFATMRRMQEQLLARISAERQAAEAMARVKIALDHVSTGVVIADTQRQIIYANHSAQRIFREAEAEAAIREQQPDFSADRLQGARLDSFGDDPRQQARLLDGLSGTHSAELELGNRRLAAAYNPVLSEAGERLGTVAEFRDRTTEVAVEREVEEIVEAAAHGDFSRRLGLEGKRGFFESLARGINRFLETSSLGMADVTEVLDALSTGDLTRQIDADYQGTLGRLKDDANATVERLRAVVGRIKEASEAIHTAASEIAAGNLDLSKRTEAEAANLDQTASSMAELNETVRQNADNARLANELATAANEVAIRGGEMVRQVVGTMEEIQGSSRKISDIIGVIDGIAFQTNILALNAAVEAARAGEQGRGFAVVATEVRGLAGRSAQAAKEIKGLIAATVGQVEMGAKLVHQAGDTVAEVVESFHRVAGLVMEISAASREQSKGIEQVAQAVGQMDEMTQRNAALVEEAAAAAASLEDQARGLIQAVGSFRLA